MRDARIRWGRPALCLALWMLSACGATSPVLRAWEAAQPASQCDHAGEDECVVLACEGGECGLFGCEDVDAEAVAQASTVPSVELARGYRPPVRGPPPFRNWRDMGIRPGARPRMTFHFRYREGFLPALPREPGKLVHHHLFPQQPELARWFRASGIDIHKFTILIPEHIHRQIHSGTGRGGMWNQAWRDYRDSKQARPVTPEELHRKAVELVFRFELTGPVVPHNAPLAPYQSMPQLRSP